MKTRLGSAPSNKSRNYAEYIHHKLRMFEDGTAAFMQLAYSQVNFDAWKAKQRAFQQICKDLSDQKVTILACGPSPFAKNSPIKGYLRGPIKELTYAFSVHALIRVIILSEHRPTLLCAWCHVRVKVSKSPHRYVTCNVCGRTTNRDINAAMNIMYFLECVLNGKAVAREFIPGQRI